MSENTIADLQMHCVEDVRHRIAEAEKALRQLRIVEDCLTNSPNSATIITIVYPIEGLDGQKVESTDSWGNVWQYMRQTEEKFRKTAKDGCPHGARRALVRVAVDDYLCQINVPEEFWVSGHPSEEVSRSLRFLLDE